MITVTCHAREHKWQTHEFTREQTTQLLEMMSFEDFENGPRCLLEVLAEVDGETP